MGKIINKELLNKMLLYFICILLSLRLTLSFNIKLIHNLLPVGVIISFMLILLNYRQFSKEWFKQNFLIIIYLIWNFVLIFLHDNMINGFKEFIYECFFLIIVLFLFNKQNKDKTKIMKLIVIINLVLNIVSIVYQYAIKHDFRNALCGIYTNSNAISNFTVLSLIIFTLMFKKENKIYNILCISFSLVVIFLSRSRTPLLVLLVYGIARILLIKKIITLDKLKKVFSFFLLITLLIIIVISYIHRNNIYPTKFEEKINDVTTNRYYLWKYSIFSLEQSLIFGVGDYNIGKYRWKMLNQETIESIDIDSRIKTLSLNNNHNGYLQLLVANGYVSFILFMLILFKNIKKINNDTFFIIIAVLLINLFENVFILTQSIYIFVLMYLFNSTDEDSNIEDNYVVGNNKYDEENINIEISNNGEGDR